ncbi:histidine phosphatase family protein [Pseudonocardia nematodicida]|uniref:Histidine phosphatase family protein n=1 Tax=Pseudonocardia nematodicida TaxID=1206997 RepID=A0ABV1KI49_9PSEU
MRLLLVRHGETAANAARRLQGDSDVPLSGAGRAGARDLGPLVASYRPEHVVVSPLDRTRETARLLGVSPDRVDPRWQEADLGQWTDRFVDDLPAAEYAAWRAGELTPPGGESFAGMTARVTGALADLPGDGVVLVVTHGGPIRAVLDHLLGLRPSRLVPVGPASLTVLDHDGGGTRLRAYNLGGPVSGVPVG